MTESMDSFSIKALQLSPQQRMSLATLLLESLDDSPSVDPNLLGELSQRASELRSGEVKGLTTEEAYGFSFDDGRNPIGVRP